jgi:hypothetical protein
MRQPAYPLAQSVRQCAGQQSWRQPAKLVDALHRCSRRDAAMPGTSRSPPGPRAMPASFLWRTSRHPASPRGGRQEARGLQPGGRGKRQARAEPRAARQEDPMSARPTPALDPLRAPGAAVVDRCWAQMLVTTIKDVQGRFSRSLKVSSGGVKRGLRSTSL